MPQTPANKLFRDDAFKDRIIGVTGAAHGIGRGISVLLLDCGARVLAIDNDSSAIDQLGEDLGDFSDHIHCACTDVTDTQAMTELIHQVEAHWGGFDGWVNNAFFSRRRPIEKQTAEEFHRIFEVNVHAAWHAIRELVPGMKQRGRGGSIVNISSIMAHLTARHATAYTASKAALEAMTKSLAIELAPFHIRVNALAPGNVLTRTPVDIERAIESGEATDVQRLRTQRRMHGLLTRIYQPLSENILPEDIAAAVLFLLSDAARMMTGSTVIMDGGRLASLGMITSDKAALIDSQQQCMQFLRANRPPGY
jgi:NAD(P)-dependent dehydrogenase (short-subunit alcohol dehydrogenase family)